MQYGGTHLQSDITRVSFQSIVWSSRGAYSKVAHTKSCLVIKKEVSITSAEMAQKKTSQRNKSFRYRLLGIIFRSWKSSEESHIIFTYACIICTQFDWNMYKSRLVPHAFVRIVRSVRAYSKNSSALPRRFIGIWIKWSIIIVHHALSSRLSYTGYTSRDITFKEPWWRTEKNCWSLTVTVSSIGVTTAPRFSTGTWACAVVVTLRDTETFVVFLFKIALCLDCVLCWIFSRIILYDSY